MDTHQPSSDAIIIHGPENRTALSELLEGYLYGLGEVCHQLFGEKGEAAMYEAIGSLFVGYLEKKGRLALSAVDPWERYCEIVRFFTENGFYGYVEMRPLGDGSYWMLETEQYAGNVWEEQGAWERGTPPCPLWSAIVYTLGQIGYTIILDRVAFDDPSRGYESTFHFERQPQAQNLLEQARQTIRSEMVGICSGCKRFRLPDGSWVETATYLAEHHHMLFSHRFCPECFAQLYPEFDAGDA